MQYVLCLTFLLFKHRKPTKGLRSVFLGPYVSRQFCKNKSYDLIKKFRFINYILYILIEIVLIRAFCFHNFFFIICKLTVGFQSYGSFMKAGVGYKLVHFSGL